jgi:hypothetical protein
MNTSYNDKKSRAIALGSFPHLQVNNDIYGVDFFTGHINYPRKKFGLDAKRSKFIDAISVIEKWDKNLTLVGHIKCLKTYCDELYKDSIPLIEQFKLIRKKFGIKKSGNLFDSDYHFLYNTEDDELISLNELRKILVKENICLKFYVNNKTAGHKIDSSKDNFLSAFVILPQDLKQRCLEPKENLVVYQFG